jgi:hypothetical protein
MIYVLGYPNNTCVRKRLLGSTNILVLAKLNPLGLGTLTQYLAQLFAIYEDAWGAN